MTRDIWDQCMVPDKTIVFTRDAWDGMWGRSLYEKKTLCSNTPLSVPEGHVPLIRALSVPIIFQDELAGQIVIANKKTDYDEKDINLMETIASSIAPVLKARLQRDNQEKKRKKAEEKLRKAHDGLEKQVEKRTAELVKTNEQLEEEIEERKRADKAVRESEERYALAVEGSTDGIWDWDITSDTVFYSDRFSEILGYSPEEFPGTMDTFRSLLHPEDADVTWVAVERHLQKRVPYNVECRLQTKSGEFRWFLARGQAIWDSKGNATRMSGSLQDITERVEALKNLRDALSEIKKLKENLEAERAYLQEEIKLEHNFENIIGQSNDLNYVLYKVEQIATTDTAVLVLGETGTGKELVARAIHGSSPRKDRPLLKVNCTTLPSNLIESELFGHERGAFTGAYARQLGRFEVANGATIFLDEIGELPLELQPKLLRVIQDGEFERLGSSQTIKVDVRIIAATNRNLEEEVRNGRFREDLWYRLNIFPITVPPLRKRMEDLPLLVEFIVDKISRRLGKSIKNIPTSVMNTLQNYHWPGNIRELENVVERAVINSSGPKLRLMEELKKRHKDLTTVQKTLKEVEHDYIVRVLEQANWKVSGKNGASEILGLDRSTLRARMRKLGIKKP
jgi:chemotaxis protein methyltransferase CheR